MTVHIYAIPEKVSHILQIAVEGGLYAADDIYRLALIYQYNWHGLVSAVCMDVWTHRGTLPDVYRDVLKQSEQYWKEEREWN